MARRDDQIFLLRGADGSDVTPLSVTAYEFEAELQDLLAKHPSLLGGGQIDPENPRRWLHVCGEASIANRMGGSRAMALDHLFLDQDATPTLVEIKRSADTRIRREVVGQMLDYAANAQAYWPPGHIRTLAASTLGDDEDALSQAVAALTEDVSWGGNLGEADRVEQYWERVDQRLEDGEMRLLFVADAIPPELRRIIEFMNAQMQRVEVLGVELPKYTGAGLKALVPRVIGQSEEARRGKSSRLMPPAASMTQERFLDGLTPEARPFFEVFIKHASAAPFKIVWGSKGFSVRVRRPDGAWASIAYGYMKGFRAFDAFEFFLGQIGHEGLRQPLEEGALALPGFEARGSYTLVCNAEEISTPARGQAILKELDRWAQAVITQAMG